MLSLSKKVCLLGDYGVGKTSLVRRFVYNLFEDKYLSTIGVKVSRKMIALPHDNDIVELTLMLWDLAGSEEFDDVRASYLRGANGAIIVCDLTRPATLETVARYAAELRQMNAAASLIIAANKGDLYAKRQLTPEQLSAQAAALRAVCHVTSAKTGANVETVFRQLGQLLIV